jgi:nucleoside-diphosphate-sugar epimerase
MGQGMNVLVTGSAGFIGSNVCRALLADGHSVFGVDNVNDAYDPRVKDWRIRSLEGQTGFEWRRADITDRQSMTRLFGERRFDAVVNLAARAGVRQSTENPWIYYETNLTGTLNLLEECRAAGVDRFVLASTSSVYGVEDMPFSETAKADRPLSPYAASKKAAEELCYSYHHVYGTDVTVLRFFTVYGPAGRPDMSVFRFVRWITEGEPLVLNGDGTQKRDFTYVEDVARGVLAALKKRMGYEVINLGSDRPVEINEVISEIERLVGRKAEIDHQPFHPLDVPATWANISKARELLDWEPRVSIEEGLARAVDWYSENRSWAAHVDL